MLHGERAVRECSRSANEDAVIPTIANINRAYFIVRDYTEPVSVVDQKTRSLNHRGHRGAQRKPRTPDRIHFDVGTGACLVTVMFSSQDFSSWTTTSAVMASPGASLSASPTGLTL